MADLPYKFWINADSGEIVPVSYHHALTVLQDPVKFGFPPGMKGTHWARPAHLAKMGKWKEADSDPTLYRIMFNNGWVRSDNSSEDVLNLETTFLPDASKVLTTLLQTGNWFTDVFLDFDHAEGAAPDSIHLEDSDEIEAFADRNSLPRRYAKLMAHTKKAIRRERDPDDDIAIPSLGGLSGPPMRDLDAVGESMERHIELARLRLLEARPPRRPIDVAERPTQTPFGRPAPLPGQLAVPGAARQVQVPPNYNAMAASVSGRDLAGNIGRPQPTRPRVPGTEVAVRTNQIVPLETLPTVVGGPRLNMTWHKVSSLPNYIVDQIRNAFQPFFRSILGANLEELSVATDLPGAGSSSADLQRMWNYLIQKGRVEDNFDMEAFGINPAVYHVENAHVVDFGGHKFFLMEEAHGHMGRFRYIYVAPGKGTFAGTNELTSDTKHLTSEAYHGIVDIGSDLNDDSTIPRRSGEMWRRGGTKRYMITNTNTGKRLEVQNLTQFCRHNKWNIAAVRAALDKGHAYRGSWKIELIDQVAEAYKQWTGSAPAGAPAATPTGPKPMMINRDAAVFLERIPAKHKAQIIRRVEAMLSGNSLPPSSEKMHITAQGNIPVYRLKSGEYRILFSLADKQITILKIAHRQDAYRGFNESSVYDGDEDLV